MPSLNSLHYADRCLVSDFALPALYSAEGGAQSPSAITIVLGVPSAHRTDIEWSHHWLSGSDAIDLSVARTETGFWLSVPELADFHINHAGNMVEVWPRVGLGTETLEHLLLDQVLPRVLAQQGELAVHGAGVSMGSQAALFLGNSGQGKSTLAASMHRHGHEVLSDDCVLLRPHPEEVSLLATYPSLRLLPETLVALFPESPTTTAMAGYSDKRRLFANEAVPGGRRLSAIYLLSPNASGSDMCHIEALAPAVACLELTRQTFVLDPSDLSRAGMSLARTAEIANRVPAFRLSYAHDFAKLPAVVAAVGQHLQQYISVASA